MIISFSRVLSRYALGCYIAAFAALYLFATFFLAHAHIWLLPRDMVIRMMHYRSALLVILLAIPTAIYLFWRGSDLIAWIRTPTTLTLDAKALHIGSRSIDYTAVASLRHQHNRDHLILTLQSGQRERIRLKLWNDPDALAVELENRISGSLHDDAMHTLQTGQTLHFGPLSVNATGLSYRKHVMPWASISNIRTQSDSEGLETDEILVIVADGKTHKIDRSKLVNEPVLLACIQHYLPRG